MIFLLAVIAFGTLVLVLFEESGGTAAPSGTGGATSGSASTPPAVSPQGTIAPVTASTTPTVVTFAQAIAQEEGFDVPGSIPNRNNNPGDLRPPNGAGNYWAGQIGVDSDGFAVFGTSDAGWNALYTNLNTHIGNNPTQTLADYIAQYAPANDGNDPTSYADNVAAALGVDSSDQLGDIFSS